MQKIQIFYILRVPSICNRGNMPLIFMVFICLILLLLFTAPRKGREMRKRKSMDSDEEEEEEEDDDSIQQSILGKMLIDGKRRAKAVRTSESGDAQTPDGHGRFDTECLKGQPIFEALYHQKTSFAMQN